MRFPIEGPVRFAERLRWEGVGGKSLPTEPRERDAVIVRARDEEIARRLDVALTGRDEFPKACADYVSQIIADLRGGS